MLRRPLVIVPLLTLLLCASCSAPNLGALWPDIVVGPPSNFTPEEALALNQFAHDQPAIARKIVGRNNELQAAIAAYHKSMIKHNREVATAAGMEQSKVDLIYPEDQ